MDDGVEGVLEVDAFAQAVGADEDAGPFGVEGLDAAFAFFGGEEAADGFDGGALELLAQVVGDVVDGGNEATKDDDRRKRSLRIPIRFVRWNLGPISGISDRRSMA